MTYIKNEYNQSSYFLVSYFSNLIDNVMNITLNEVILPFDQLINFVKYLTYWFGFYLIIHFLPIKNSSPKKTLDTKNRIVSIVHASVMLVLCLYDYLYWQEDKCGVKNSDFQNNLLIFSCSYFTYDFIICLYFGISDFPMFIHHFMVIIAEYSGILYGTSANEMIRAMISAEISNPIMHLRTIVSNYGLKHSKLFLIFEFMYFTSYSLARLIFGFQVSIFTVFCQNNLFIVKFSGAVVWGQSIKYAYNMIGIGMKRAKELKERSIKKVELFWFSYNPKLSTLTYILNEKNEMYVP